MALPHGAAERSLWQPRGLRHKKGVPGEPWGSPGTLGGGGDLLSRFRSIIGAPGFNFSVRNGKRWSPRAVAALSSLFCSAGALRRGVVRSPAALRRGGGRGVCMTEACPLRVGGVKACLPGSGLSRPEERGFPGRERADADACPAAAARPPALCVLAAGAPSDRGPGRGKGFGLLVSLGCRRRRPCTCDLSTSSSPTALPVGHLISEGASCLDAFSTYPGQTRLPGGAPGGTTGAPEVCPTRSSRTSVGSHQMSCAHNR